MYAILYKIVRFIVYISFRVFYNTVVINPDYFDHKPAIVVTNHPNTLTDAFNVGDKFKQRIYFLANSSLFVNYGWFFKTAAIPIERYQDTKGQPLSNDKAFARCDEFLGGGGVLYIAPEGGSKRGRRLRALKTGTARIGFSAESKNNWRLGLKIMPVGVTYSDANSFRSNVVLHAGEGLSFVDYQDFYKQDDREAVRKMTMDMDRTLRNLMIDTVDEEEDEMLYKVEAILQTEDPISFKNQYFRNKKILEHIRQQTTESPDSMVDFKNSLNTYTDGLKSLKLKDKVAKNSIGIGSYLMKILLMILGFPFFVYGYINNFLANYIPALMVKVINTYVEYTATIKLTIGVLTYPIFYGLQVYLVHSFFGNSTITLLYALTVLPLGWIALKYMDYSGETLQYIRKAFLSKEKKSILSGLMEKRKMVKDALL